MDQVDYRPVSVCLRPPRVAIVYRTEGDWTYHARQVVASMSRFWGGAGMVLLPAGGDGKLSPTILRLLRLYDPDLVFGHVLTVRDLPIVNPEGAARFAKDFSNEGDDPSATLARFADEPLGENSWDDAADQINDWCSPFKGFDKDVRSFGRREIHWLYRSSRGLPPESYLTPVPPFGDESRVFTLRLDDVDASLALMIETRTGSVNAAGMPGFDALPLGIGAEDVPDFVGLAITGRPEMSHWDAHAYYLRSRGLLEMPQPPALLTAEQFVAETPMALGQRWTTWVGNGDPPVVCVIGDTADDHALALMCDRMFSHGAWIPASLLERDTAEGRSARASLRSLHLLPGARHNPVLVTSASQPIEQLAPTVDELNNFVMLYEGDGTPVSRDPDFVVVSPEALAAEKSRRFLADPYSYSARRTVPVRASLGDMSILTPIPLPLPQIADEDGNEDARWCVDVAVSGYSAPPRTTLASRAFLQDPAGSIPDTVTRSGRSGVTFGSANMGFVMAGAPREGRLAHPLLRFPSAEQIFAEIAAAQSASVKRSDAGRRASIAVELWGSLDALRADLKGPVRLLLNAFMPPIRRGPYDTGYAIREDGYLAFADAEAALRGTGEAARPILDRLITTKILRRGLILSCGRCRWQAFYRIEELGPSTFLCEACGNVSALIKETWANNEAEPMWHYSLDQVVRELLRQNGDVPLLAVDQLAQGRRSVLWAPEFAIIDDHGEVELDIAVIIDGRVIIGEAKSNDMLAAGAKTNTKAAQRLVAAAQTLSADEIVLATSTARWKPGVRTAVDAALDGWTRGPKPQIIELVNVGFRPPTSSKNDPAAP